MTYDQLKSAVKRAVNVRLKEEGYSLKDLGLGESEDDDVMGQELNRFKQEIQPQNPEEVGVEDEPIPEVSDEKKQKIYAAYNSLVVKNIRNPNYSPTTDEIVAELDRMEGIVKPKATRTFPKEAEPYLEEGINLLTNPVVVQKIMANLEGIFKQAIFNISKRLQGQDIADIEPEKLQKLVTAEADKIANEKALAMANESGINEEKDSKPKEKKEKEMGSYSPFKELGTTFKPKSQSLYPKKKKKPQTSVKIAEGLGDDEVAEIYWEKYPYYLKKAGDSTHFYMSNNRNALDSGNAMVSHIGEHQGRPYYNDVRSWLKGGESPNGKDYDDLNNMQSSSTGPMLKANESTDRDKYEDVVFLQGDEAYEPLERLDREGPEAALEYLKQWHYPGEHQGSQTLGHGSEDKTYEKDGYIMSWNPQLEYIGLQYDMSKLNEPAVSEGVNLSMLRDLGIPNDKNAEKQAKHDIYTDPELRKQHANYPQPNDFEANVGDEFALGEDEKSEGDGKLPGVDADDEGNPIPAIEPDFKAMGLEPQGDGMSLEPQGDEIEQIANDKEEVGELIPGGKGEGKSPLEFAPDQIKRGMKVEMEHTDDPMLSLEIALDHLTEDPEYYTEKETPEASAQFGAAKDTEEGGEGDDKETTDMLLGFKPHNVGDEIEGDETPEEIPQTPETPEVAKDVQDSEESTPEELPDEKKEIGEDLGYSERDLKDRDPATWHQIQIAKKTIRMPGAMANVMGGMTKEEAREILKKRGIKFDEK